MGFAMAVTHPFAGNLGGGGFMLIRFADGRSTFIDFRERAPEKASRNMYLDAKGELTKDSIEGWRSSGVPGTVRGFEMAVSKYGKRTWAENMAPAIELARKASRSRTRSSESLKGSRDLASDPESKRIFQKNGAFYDVGETLAQPELAQTLERIAKNGADEFYEGETAKRFADEMAKHGGIISLDRSEELQGDRAHAADRQVQELHDHHRRRRRAPAASRCSRCSASSRARATRRPARVRRPRSTTWPRRCASPTPTATSTSAIRTS